MPYSCRLLCKYKLSSRQCSLSSPFEVSTFWHSPFSSCFVFAWWVESRFCSLFPFQVHLGRLFSFPSSCFSCFALVLLWIVLVLRIFCRAFLQLLVLPSPQFQYSSSPLELHHSAFESCRHKIHPCCERVDKIAVLEQPKDEIACPGTS
jgi:hypothetical protein